MWTKSQKFQFIIILKSKQINVYSLTCLYMQLSSTVKFELMLIFITTPLLKANDTCFHFRSRSLHVNDKLIHIVSQFWGIHELNFKLNCFAWLGSTFWCLPEMHFPWRSMLKNYYQERINRIFFYIRLQVVITVCLPVRQSSVLGRVRWRRWR